MDKIIELIRAIVRPIITMIAVASTVLLVLLQIPVPEWYQSLIIMIVSWWFATRTANRGGR